MNIIVDDMSFGYSRNALIFTRCNAEFRAGRTMLLGSNGAGKSTLLALMADGLRPAAGRICVDGLGAANDRRNRRRYRRAVAWLPQTLPVFPGLSVRESVAYSGWLKGLARREAWDAAEGALRSVDLSHRAAQRASTLSGGQTKRLGIASTLVSGPRWILLDEPLAGLDPVQRARVAETLRELPDSVSVIVSTHQTDDIASDFGAVAVLTDGELHQLDPQRSNDALKQEYARLVEDDR